MSMASIAQHRTDRSCFLTRSSIPFPLVSSAICASVQTLLVQRSCRSGCPTLRTYVDVTCKLCTLWFRQACVLVASPLKRCTAMLSRGPGESWNLDSNSLWKVMALAMIAAPNLCSHLTTVALWHVDTAPTHAADACPTLRRIAYLLNLFCTNNKKAESEQTKIRE